MSAVTVTSPAASESVPRSAADRRPPLLRLTRVELRKAVDTRAGLWLLIVIGALGVVLVVVRLLAGPRSERTLPSIVETTQLPFGLLLPVLGILLITSEWSQRTALTTFALVPHRERVVTAKLLAMTVLAVLMTVASLLASFVGFAVGRTAGTTSGGWDLSAGSVAELLLGQVLNMLLGAGFGLLLLSSAAAIVLSFALPTAWSLVSSLVPALRDEARWLDTARTMSPLFDPTSPAMDGQAWARLAVSLLVWLVVPMAAGLFRLHRREVS